MSENTAGFLRANLIGWYVELLGEGFTIYRNEFAPVSGNALTYDGSTPIVVRDNSFLGGPAIVGIDNQSESIVDARDNWWGHPSGPTHPSNPAGESTSVSDNVLFDLWFSDAISRNDVLPTMQTAESKDAYAPESQHSLVADPIDVSTGAHILKRDLFWLQGARTLRFSLHYSSRDPNDSVLGYGWHHSHDWRLSAQPDESVVIGWPDGRQTRYTHVSGGIYENVDGNSKDELTKLTGGSYELLDKNRMKRKFDNQGQMILERDRTGLELIYQYADGLLVSVVEPLSGRAISFTYSQERRLDAVAGSGVGTTMFSRDAAGDLIAITDALGHVQQYSYDQIHRVLTQTDELGVVLFTNIYDTEGRVIEQEDSLAGNLAGTLTYEAAADGSTATTVYSDRTGSSKTYVHDSQLRLIAVTDEVGSVTGFTWDEFGNRTSVIDSLGQDTTYTYDGRGNLISTTDAVGNVSEYAYDERDNMIRITDPLGAVVERSYDAQNRLVSETDPLGETTSYTYDGDGLRTAETLPGGGVRRVEYQHGLPVREIDATGRVVDFQYDAAGRLISRSQGEGSERSYQYDPMGRLVAETDELGNEVMHEYDPKGRRVQTTDESGAVTQFAWDTDDRLISETDPLGAVTSYEYDGEGRLAAVVDARGMTVASYTYDLRGLRTQTADGEGVIVQFEYDAIGRLIREIDGLGNETEHAYDALGRVTATTNSLNQTTTYSYDPRGRVVAMTDPSGNSSARTYDEAGQLVRVDESGTTSSTQKFDAEGRIVRLVDPSGAATEFQYDREGRLLREIAPDDGEVLHTYDDRGLRTSTVNARGQVREYTYDAAGRLVSLSDPDGAVTFSYDERGDRLTASDAEGSVVRTFDAAGRLASFTGVYGRTVDYEYDSTGQLISLTYPDGSNVNYSYDDAGRLASVVDWAGRTTTYAYDDAGRPAQISNPDGTTAMLVYDAAGQIVSQVVGEQDGSEFYRFEISRGPSGQVTSESGPGMLPPSPGTVQLEYTPDGRVFGLGGAPVQHDADGNVTSAPLEGASRSFVFDSRNRLRSVDGVSYTYDAENRRVSVNVNGHVTKRLIAPLFDREQTLEERASDGSIIARYVYGPGLLGRESGDGSYRTYHFDSRGSTIALSDTTSTVTDRYWYTPFGALRAHEGTTQNPFRYGGRDGVVTDPNGLYHLRARYYHPELRRFLSRDSIRGDLADPQSLNRYAFVAGNPISFVDPDGDVPQLVVGAVLGGAIGAVAYSLNTALDPSPEAKWSWKAGGAATAGGAVAGALFSVNPVVGVKAAAAVKVKVGASAARGVIGAVAGGAGAMTTTAIEKRSPRNWSSEDVRDIVVSAAAGAVVAPGFDRVFGKVLGRPAIHLSKQLLGFRAQRQLAQGLLTSGAPVSASRGGYRVGKFAADLFRK